MSRTIVVFHLPQNQLAYAELGDLAGKPVEGNYLVLDGARYRVLDVTESLGEFKSDGSLTCRSGLEKLLEILAVLFDKDAMNLLRGLRNIGTGDQPETSGSIIMPRKNFVGDFDHVVVVRLKASGNKTDVSDVLGQLLKTFVAGSNPAAADGVLSNARSSVVPPIIVNDDAATEQ